MEDEKAKEQELNDLRKALKVLSPDHGTVVGRLIYSDNGDMIDCSKGTTGMVIPSNIDGIWDMKSDATFILLVMNADTLFRLTWDRFYNRFPCIIISAKGLLDYLFLRKMKMVLNLPVLGLLDCDPRGLKLLSVYGNMSCAHLTTSDIKWLGLRPSDLDKYKIPEYCRLRMTKRDIKTAKELLEDDFVKKNPGWVEELTLMVKTKQKAEIPAFSALGLLYLTEVYLPLKLQEKDWL